MAISMRGRDLFVSSIKKNIEEFIRKHPENVNTWTDGDTITIQISNIGIRDTLFPNLAYLVKTATITKDELGLFNMPTECVYVSDRIIRFTCFLDILATYEANNKGLITSYDSDYNIVNPTVRSIKKFFSRLRRSNALNSDKYQQVLEQAVGQVCM